MDEFFASLLAPTMWGPFTKQDGDRPQEMAYAAARAAGVAAPLAVALDRYNFYAFANAGTREVFLEEQSWGGSDRELIERVDGSRPFRPFLDVDAPPGELGPEVVETIRAAAEGVARAWGVPADLAGFDLATNHRTDKSSAHIVASGWLVPDGPAGRRFAEEVAAAGAPFIDIGASQCSRGATLGLRLPMCRKLAKPLNPPTEVRGRCAKHIPGSWLEPRGDAPCRMADWCLQGETPPTGLYTDRRVSLSNQTH